MEGAGTEETQQTKTQLKSFAPLISHVKKSSWNAFENAFFLSVGQELAAYVESVYKIRKNKKSCLIV